MIVYDLFMIFNDLFMMFYMNSNAFQWFYMIFHDFSEKIKIRKNHAFPWIPSKSMISTMTHARGPQTVCLSKREWAIAAGGLLWRLLGEATQRWGSAIFQHVGLETVLGMGGLIGRLPKDWVYACMGLGGYGAAGRPLRDATQRLGSPHLQIVLENTNTHT